MTRGFDCEAAREAVHATLDTELVDAGVKGRLEAHLSACPECRAFAAELRTLQRGLRALPELKLPDEVLERVWDRTVHAGQRRSWVGPRHFAAAAAAVVILLLGGLWLRSRPVSTGPSEAELAHAAAEARLVLKLTSDALRKTEQAAFKDVLTDEISDALRRAPIHWPERSAAQRRGS